MRAYWGVLLFILMAGVMVPAKSQGLTCPGRPIITESRCSKCPGAYMSRFQVTCSQPTDINGNGCGARTCDGVCTCQGTPAGVEGIGDIPVVTRNPEVKRDPKPRIDHSNDTSPTPILRGGDLTKSGWPTPNPYHTSEQAGCFSLVGWKFVSDPASGSFFVTMRNNCNRCLTGSFLVSNQHRQFASTGQNRHASVTKTFSPGASIAIPFSVHNRRIWEPSTLAWQLYESHFVECPVFRGVPSVR